MGLRFGKIFGGGVLLVFLGLLVVYGVSLLRVYFADQGEVRRLWTECTEPRWQLQACILNLRNEFQNNRVISLVEHALGEPNLSSEERAWLWFQLGEIYKYEDRVGDSENAFRQAVNLLDREKPREGTHDTHFSSRYQLCLLLASDNRLVDAKKCFRAGLNTFPGSTRLERGLQVISSLTAQGDSDRRTRVIIRYRGTSSESGSFFVKGSWNEKGEHDTLKGWEPVAMVRTENVWSAEFSLTPGTELPYVAIVESENPKSKKRQILGSQPFRLGASPIETIDVPAFPPQVPTKSPLTLRAGDGKRRVIVLWPDSGTWLHLMTLVRRGEASNVADMIETGAFGNLDSDPPITAIATDKLTYFGGKEGGLRAGIGTALTQIKGVRMFDALVPQGMIRWFSLGDRIDLWDYLQAHGVNTVNLIFSDPWCNGRDLKSLEAIKRYGFPTSGEIAETLVDSPAEKAFLRQIFRTAEEETPGRRSFIVWAWRQMHSRRLLAEKIWSTGDFDFMVLRYASFDLIHHYDSILADAKGTQIRSLYAFYQYLDESVGALRNLLDEDDTFLLISDHGARNMLAHHRDSIFVAAGAGISPGRFLGSADIRIFPSQILDLFGIGLPQGVVQPQWVDH